MRALLVLLAVTALSVASASAARVPPSPEQEVILEKLAHETLSLPSAPKGMPDPAEWLGISGRWTAGLSHTKSAREEGNPLAIFMIAERICPDTDEGTCYVSILLEFSTRMPEERAEVDNVIRYSVLSSDGKHVSGYALNHQDEAGVTDTYWVRRDGTWLQHAQGSPEHVVTKKLLDVFSKLMGEANMHLKEPASRPAGTIVQYTTPHSGRRTFLYKENPSPGHRRGIQGRRYRWDMTRSNIRRRRMRISGAMTRRRISTR